jgi:hypothetical protein
MPMSLARKFSELKEETRRQWREWAAAMADGKASPTPTAVLDAGATLGIPTPFDALESDVAAIAEAQAIEARIERTAALDEARVAPYGGLQGARQRLVELEAEVKELRRKLHGHGWDAGYARGELSRLKQKHPRVFDIDTPKNGAKKK